MEEKRLPQQVLNDKVDILNDVKSLVAKDINELNERRDKNLDTKLGNFRNELIEKVSNAIDLRIKSLPFHQTSPETVKEMDRQKADTNNKFNEFNIMIHDIQNEIKNINESLKDYNCQQKELLIGLQELNTKLDTKYSAKWVERTFVAILGAVGLSVLYALLNLILRD